MTGISAKLQVMKIKREIRKFNRLLMVTEYDTQVLQKEAKAEIIAELDKEPVMPMVKLHMTEASEILYISFSQVTADNEEEIKNTLEVFRNHAEMTMIDEGENRIMYAIKVNNAGKVQNENFYHIAKDFAEMQGYWFQIVNVVRGK